MRMQVWVITGDKQETAINIAIACKLVRNPGSLLVCNETTPEAAEKRLQELAHLLQRQYEPVKHHNPTPFAGEFPPPPPPRLREENCILRVDSMRAGSMTCRDGRFCCAWLICTYLISNKRGPFRV